MVQIIEPDQTWAEAAKEFSKGLVSGYTGRADELALQEAVTKLGPKASPRDILNAVTGTRTYNPEAKQQFFKNYLGASEFEQMQSKAAQEAELRKEQIASTKGEEERAKEEHKAKQKKIVDDQAKADAIIEGLPGLSPEQKAAFKGKVSLDAAESMLKEQTKPKVEKPTTFQKTLEEQQAKNYFKLSEEIPKLKDTLSAIKHVEELSNEIGVIKAGISNVYLTERASQLESESFPLIEPIVKTFNPSGPIAERKLKLIQDKYQIKPTDLPAKRQGKINALRRYAQVALNRAQEKMKLYEQYGGLPPKEAVDNFDKENDTISDAMLDYDLEGEEVKAEGLPDPAKFKGKTKRNKTTGESVYSDGTRWIKK